MKIKTNIPANVPPSTPLRLLDLIFSVILIVLVLVVLEVLVVLVVLIVLDVLYIFSSLVEIDASELFVTFKIVLENVIADEE